jgi:hypothetical protein
VERIIGHLRWALIRRELRVAGPARAGNIWERLKSSKAALMPLNSNGSPVAFASAYAKNHRILGSLDVRFSY